MLGVVTPGCLRACSAPYVVIVADNPRRSCLGEPVQDITCLVPSARRGVFLGDEATMLHERDARWLRPA